jgi:hypothetical protein
MKLNRIVLTRLFVWLLASQTFTILSIPTSAQSAPNSPAARPANICDQAHEVLLSRTTLPHAAIAKTSQVEAPGGAQ